MDFLGSKAASGQTFPLPLQLGHWPEPFCTSPTRFCLQPPQCVQPCTLRPKLRPGTAEALSTEVTKKTECTLPEPSQVVQRPAPVHSSQVTGCRRSHSLCSASCICLLCSPSRRRCSARSSASIWSRSSFSRNRSSISCCCLLRLASFSRTRPCFCAAKAFSSLSLAASSTSFCLKYSSAWSCRRRPLPPMRSISSSAGSLGTLADCSLGRRFLDWLYSRKLNEAARQGLLLDIDMPFRVRPL
mmetsp:Transcript_177744/g.569893  ORF Transcript_177744/g.569893 Transcript_177744/m.569893 type:complete len:243 (+) Transcript_177744:232-960(+)